MVPSSVSTEKNSKRSVTALHENKNRVLLDYGGHENSTDVLVPPNPKELEMAARMGIFFTAANGMNAPSNSGSGCSRLSVAGAIPWWIANTLKIASTDPAAPRRWPIAPFVEENARPPDVAWSPKTDLIAFTSTASPRGVDVACAFK
uniref:Uncharacterized protein n=1 Tax=Arundo donax TaxID=35708 RepID=A0A0A9GEU2_ARUDO